MRSPGQRPVPRVGGRPRGAGVRDEPAPAPGTPWRARRRRAGTARPRRGALLRHVHPALSLPGRPPGRRLRSVGCCDMMVVLAGTSGIGKTTIGNVLATRLGWTFEDSDALPSPAQLSKMQSGEPLTDADRWPWLETVAAWMDQRIAAGESAVIAWSALQRSCRDYPYR